MKYRQGNTYHICILHDKLALKYQLKVNGPSQKSMSHHENFSHDKRRVVLKNVHLVFNDPVLPTKEEICSHLKNLFYLNALQIWMLHLLLCLILLCFIEPNVVANVFKDKLLLLALLCKEGSFTSLSRFVICKINHCKIGLQINVKSKSLRRKKRVLVLRRGGIRLVTQVAKLVVSKTSLWCLVS